MRGTVGGHESVCIPSHVRLRVLLFIENNTSIYGKYIDYKNIFCGVSNDTSLVL
jgi:hypothetical protein